MRGFILLTLLVGLACCEAPKSVETFTNFLKGHLSGLGESQSVDGLKNCIKDGDEIISKIRTSLDEIRTIDTEKLKAGLPRLMDATKEFLAMVKPCSGSFTKYARLANELEHANVISLIRKVQNSPGGYFHLAINGLEALNKNDFVGFGVAVGTIEKMLFLSRVQDDVPMPDFVKGMLVGLEEKGDFNKLSQCIKENNDIFAVIKEALSNIKNMRPEDLKAGSILLINGTTTLTHMLAPCVESFATLKKIIAALPHADVQKMIRIMQTHAGAFFHLSIDGLEGFLNNKYNDAGKAVGSILSMLFIKTRLDGVFLDFIKGFLEGINEKGDANKLLECIKGGEEIMDKVMEAIEYLLKLDMENIMKGLTMLVEAVHELAEKFKPCSEGFQQVQKLIKAIANVDIMQIFLKIMADPAKLIHDLLDCVDMMKNGFYDKAGKDLGDFVFILFLSK